MKQKGNVLIILAILAAALVGIILYNQSLTKTSQQPTRKDQGQIKTFQSKNLKITLELPNDFSASDESSRITVNSTEGQIYVNRNGTQYDNLDDYLIDFDTKTTLEIAGDQTLTINNYQTRLRVITNSNVGLGKEKIYFIYFENFVYKISTTSEALFDNLDQIAQSFRYTP